MSATCDHKFVDSKLCLKCGWAAPPRPKKRRRYVRPGHCVNCGGPCDAPCVDNTGQAYLGCRVCRVCLDPKALP